MVSSSLFSENKEFKLEWYIIHVENIVWAEGKHGPSCCPLAFKISGASAETADI